MKTRKPRYIYIFSLYLPIVAIGIAIATLWPRVLSTSMEWLNFSLLALVIFLAFTPYARTIIPGINKGSRYAYPLLFSLQLASIIAGYGIYHAFYTIPALLQTIPANSIQPRPFSWSMIIFPWPIALLLAIALGNLNNSAHTPALLRFTLKPLFNQSLFTIFGVGIDVFIKQGFLCACAYTLTIGILQLDLVLANYIGLPVIGGLRLSTIIIGGLLIFLLSSKFWGRLTHYLWLNKIAINYLLLILSVLFSCALLLMGLSSRLLAALPMHTTTPLTQFNLSGHIQDYATLTVYCLWILWLPLIAKTISRLYQNQSVQKMLLSGLILPAGISLVILILHTFNPQALQQINLFVLNNNYGIVLLFGAVIVILAITGFRDPESEGLIQLTALTKSTRPTSSHQMMRQISNFIIMYALLFLLFGAKILTIFTFSITFPNLITISVASLIALYLLFVEK